MEKTLLKYIKIFQKKHRNGRRYMALLLVLALLTSLTVNWKLRGTGIAATADYECGLEEHVHDKDCYELVCTKDGEDGDIKWSKLEDQDDADTSETEIETAKETETAAEAESKAEAEEIETKTEEKAETADGTDEEEIVASPSDAARDDSDAKQHIHTKKCYRLICEIPEHIHTSKCMSNIASDVEEKTEWESTIPAFTSDESQAEKMVAVAMSQIGYHESEENFKLADDGVTKQGYTRYGEWYGNPYGDWSAMFAAFVLHYAGISKTDFPVNSGCPAWIVQLGQKGLYKAAGSYEPNYGDIVFLDLDDDSKADHAGIVANLERDEEDEKLVSVTAVVGDLNDEVEETQYDAAGSEILGYGMIPGNGTSILPDTAIYAADGDAVDMSGHVTGISGSGTVYDTNGNIYSTELRMDFHFDPNEVKESGLNYYYDYPEGIIIPSGILTGEKYTLLDDSGRKAGTYYFTKTEDGTYRVGISFDQEYIDEHGGDSIDGHIRFKGQVSEDKADDDGNIKIIGKDGVTIEIPKSEIIYPDDETNKYDITTSKRGYYDVQNGKLIYTVYVSSFKGTPDDIAFRDVIEASGMTLGEPSITVTEEKVPRYFNNGGYWDASWIETVGTVNVDYTYSDGKLEMTLPKIDPAVEKADGGGTAYKEYTRYKIVYTYDVSDLAAQPTAGNHVTASSKKNDTEVKSDSEYRVDIKNEHSLNKNGWFDSASNRIRWTITVNSNKVNIAGSTLTDKMLAELAKGTDLEIKPDTGYEITRDADGKITEIKFNATENNRNTNTYTIQYWTEAEAKWDGQTITNDASFKPGDGSSEIDKTGTVTVGGGDVSKKAGTADVAEDEKTAVVPWTSTLTVPSGGIPAGTEITDDATRNQWGGTGGRQYMTRDQAIEWAQGIYWADSNGNQVGEKIDLTKGNLAEITFITEDGEAYSWSEIQSDGQKFGNKLFKIWKVRLNQDLAQPEGAKKLIFTYSTTADLTSAGLGTTNYYNTIKAGNKEASATYEYKKGGLVKTDENGSADKTNKVNADGTLIWKITANLAKDSDYLDITDNFPEGVTLVGLKGDGNINVLHELSIDADGKITGTNNGYTVSGSYQDQKVTLRLQRVQSGEKLSTGAYLRCDM